MIAKNKYDNQFSGNKREQLLDDVEDESLLPVTEFVDDRICSPVLESVAGMQDFSQG